MKTLITSTGNNLDSKFDQRFGRTSWFCIYDQENGETSFIENENKNLNGGAGIKTVEKIAEMGVNRIISGDFGPKAKEMLEKLKIQMIKIEGENKSVMEILNSVKN